MLAIVLIGAFTSLSYGQSKPAHPEQDTDEKEEPATPSPSSAVSFQTGLSATFLKYQESSAADFTESAITAKAGAVYSFPDSAWDLGTTAYMTLAPLQSSDPELRVRFLGVNLRAGYRFLTLGPFRARLLAGWYYLTSIPSQRTFGYRDVQGPQIYPSFTVALPGRKAVSIYGKYSPVASDLSEMKLSNREIALGGAFTFASEWVRTTSIVVDFSQLAMEFSGISLRSSSASLGLSVEW